MRKRFVTGNWKMNMLRNDASALARGIVSGTQGLAGRLDIVIAPPFTSLEAASRELGESGIELGAQNAYWEQKGAYTGEISPGMLVDAGCKWVILGHSERRRKMGETDEEVRKKLTACLDAGLNVILCVGETLYEREHGMTLDVVSTQVRGALEGAEHDVSRLVVAYEPVWAIGTGKTATPDEAQEVHAEIREITGTILGLQTEDLRIVYGGSVTEMNIRELVGEDDIDGALVGGASLSAEKFSEIVQIAGE